MTGSYNGAIWATIVIYAVSGVLCLLVPIYQRLFARERFVMMLGHGNRCSCARDAATTAGDEVEKIERGDREGCGNDSLRAYRSKKVSANSGEMRLNGSSKWTGSNSRRDGELKVENEVCREQRCIVERVTSL